MDRAPFYFNNYNEDTGEDVELSEVDIDHIMSKIREGYSQGDICTDENTRGWWSLTPFKKNYHVVIPYFYHFHVEAISPEEAIREAHNSTGKMGEYDEQHIFVEEE